MCLRIKEHLYRGGNWTIPIWTKLGQRVVLDLKPVWNAIFGTSGPAQWVQGGPKVQNMTFFQNGFLAKTFFSQQLENSLQWLLCRFLAQKHAVFGILKKYSRSGEIWPAAVLTLEACNFFVRQATDLIFQLQIALGKCKPNIKNFWWQMFWKRDIELQSLGFLEIGVFTLQLPCGWSEKFYSKNSNNLSSMPDITAFYGGVHICKYKAQKLGQKSATPSKNGPFIVSCSIKKLQKLLLSLWL